MVEALVGILVLSMGALGFAALQINGIGKNASALYRTKATQLAYEMGDRIRANQAGAGTGAYASLVSAVAAPACGTKSACTPADMAQLDFAQWRANVARSLPDGVGVVCVTSTPASGTAGSPACDGAGTHLAIKVFWVEKSSKHRFSTVVRP